MNPARRERHRLADTFVEVGPDVDTLCAGWDARQLAAHLVVRERRPDAAAGIVVSRLSGWTERVQDAVAERDWDDLVDEVRDGPPVWSPTRIDRVDEAVNTLEFFVHHEDVRRAQPGWTVRELDDDLTAALRANLGRMAKMLARRAPAGIELAPIDGESFIAKSGDPTVTVSGPIGELALFMFGRQSHAMVDLAGPAESVEAIRTASFGI